MNVSNNSINNYKQVSSILTCLKRQGVYIDYVIGGGKGTRVSCIIEFQLVTKRYKKAIDAKKLAPITVFAPLCQRADEDETFFSPNVSRFLRWFIALYIPLIMYEYNQNISQYSFHFTSQRGEVFLLSKESRVSRNLFEKSVEEKLRRSHSHTKRCIVALNFHNDVSNGKTVDEEDDADRSV